MEQAEISAIAEELKQRISAWPYAFAFVYNEKLTHFPAEAREAWRQVAHLFPLRGTLIIGGRYDLQAVGQLMMRATQRLTGFDNPTLSFPTEAEARAWLEERRRAMQAGQ